MVKKRRAGGIYTALKVLLVIGMLLSLFLVYEHFSPSASKYCTFGESMDCGIVNKSPYANLDGLSYLLTIDYGLPIGLIDIASLHWSLDVITSNAFLGFLTLLIVFGLVNAKQKGKSFLWIKQEKARAWIRGLLTFGVIYGLYLIFIQHVLLKSYCIYCLGLDVVLIVSCIIAWRMKP